MQSFVCDMRRGLRSKEPEQLRVKKTRRDALGLDALMTKVKKAACFATSQKPDPSTRQWFGLNCLAAKRLVLV